MAAGLPPIKTPTRFLLPVMGKSQIVSKLSEKNTKMKFTEWA